MPITQHRMVKLLTDAEHIHEVMVGVGLEIERNLDLYKRGLVSVEGLLLEIAVLVTQLKIPKTEAMLLEAYHFKIFWKSNEKRAERNRVRRRAKGVVERAAPLHERKLDYSVGHGPVDAAEAMRRAAAKFDMGDGDIDDMLVPTGPGLSEAEINKIAASIDASAPEHQEHVKKMEALLAKAAAKETEPKG